MKLLLTLLSIILQTLSFGQEEGNSHIYKNLIFSANGGFGIIVPEPIGLGGYALHYRFDNLKHAFGLTLNGDLGMNSKSKTVSAIDDAGDPFSYKADVDFTMLTYAADYRYYLQDPSSKKITFNIGASFGLCRQFQIVSPSFVINIPTFNPDGTIDLNGINDDPPETFYIKAIGYTYSTHFGWEYATKYFLLFMEANVGYTRINSKIDYFGNNNVFNASLRFGVGIEIFKKE